MASTEISVLKFGVLNFFSLILNRSLFTPVITSMAEIVKAIIEAEAKPDQEKKAKVEYIYHNTNDKINQPLALVELAVFRNMDRGLNKEIDFENGSFTIAELYKALDNIRWELVSIVTSIIKKYTMDLPLFDMGSMMGGNKIGLFPELMAQPTEVTQLTEIAKP
jgi:hypothetical protein